MFVLFVAKFQRSYYIAFSQPTRRHLKSLHFIITTVTSMSLLTIKRLCHFLVNKMSFILCDRSIVVYTQRLARHDEQNVFSGSHSITSITAFTNAA